MTHIPRATELAARHLARSLSALPLAEAQAAFEALMVDAYLDRTQGNKSHAAKLAGYERASFSRLVGRRSAAKEAAA